MQCRYRRRGWARESRWFGFAVVLMLLGASVAGAHDTHSEMEAEHERVPNNGAFIRVLAPENSSHFKVGVDILVRIEVIGFALGVDGNHWHVNVDGEPWCMILDESTETALHGIEPGTHVVEVLLADGEHRDLEEGDILTLVVE